MVFCLLVAAGVLGFFGWQHWEKFAIEKEAVAVIEEARNLLTRVQAQEDLSSFQEGYETAWQSFQQGREELAEERFPEAVKNGRRSVALLSSILDALEDQSDAGEAHFISVAGRVEFRRGEHGEWEGARVRTSLRDGYYVRTSERGSASIMFVDGNLYHVRPNTLFLVSRQRTASGAPGTQAIRMEYGWVDLSTTQRSGRVATPGVEAEVRSDSSASVAYSQDEDSGRFAAFRGGMRVASDGGITREVGALQEVVQSKGLLSEPRSLPRAPEPLRPQDNHEVTFNPQTKVALGWQPVFGASSYALQVSRNALFNENIIDEQGRRKTSATLGVRGEGAFQWRVAAVNDEGRMGPWSVPRKFRIKANLESRADTDTEPPELALNAIQTYGSIFLVSGITEPGATVSVRNEQVQVSADGSFTKALQVYERGWSFVVVRAKDAYGNETVRPLRLYVDNI